MSAYQSATRSDAVRPKVQLSPLSHLVAVVLVAFLPFVLVAIPTPGPFGNLLITGTTTVDSQAPFSAALIHAAPHTVSYDRYSILIDHHRTVLFGGEYQYWRTPSPDQWPVVLAQLKAAGLNAITVGVSWQYQSPAPGVFNFSGIRDVGRFMDDVTSAGMYVIARPGPAYDSESNASNLPGWLLTTPHLRDNGGHAYCGSGTTSQAYTSAYRDWFHHVLPLIASRQLTNGHGAVVAVQIENEYSPTCGSKAYMQDLHNLVRQSGIIVPIITNNNTCCVAPGSWHFQGQDGQPVVDIPAVDTYPCTSGCPFRWGRSLFASVDSIESRIRQTTPDAPVSVAELQGGYFSGWGGTSYSDLRKSLNPAFAEVLQASALGQGVTLASTYMAAGGTSWGYLAAPNTATSYDYAAPIDEWGTPGATYGPLKRSAMFATSFSDLVAATSRTSAIRATNPALLYAVRTTVGGRQAGASMIVLRNTGAVKTQSTKLILPMGKRAMLVPVLGSGIALTPHSAAILVTNYRVRNFRMLYSTSRPLTRLDHGTDHVVELYGPAGTFGETALAFSTPPEIQHADSGITTSFDYHCGCLTINYLHHDSVRSIVINDKGQRLTLIFTGSDMAAKSWLVSTHTGPYLVFGPPMVTQGYRNDATIQAALSPDTTATVFTPQGMPTLQLVSTSSGDVGASTLSSFSSSGPDPQGFMVVHLVSDVPPLGLPHLSSWRFSSESPESMPNFNDQAWTHATESATRNPNVPSSDTLLADDYGFHYGFVWYRGTFTSTGSDRVLRMSARGSYSVWVNGRYAGSSTTRSDLKNPGDELAQLNRLPANSSYADTLDFRLNPIRLGFGKRVTIAILTQSLGHNVGFSNGELSRSPMGLLSATIVGPRRQPLISWRLQGGVVSKSKSAMPYNSSGLYGERHGWYRARYDDSRWRTVSVPDDWMARGLHLQGVGWYRTHFSLHMQGGITAPIALNIPYADNKVVIWLNGLLIGQYWKGVGPQNTFYLPAGLLHEQGDNTLALAVWNRGEDGGLSGGASLQPYSVTPFIQLTSQ